MDISYILKKLNKYETKSKNNKNNIIYKQKLDEYYDKANEIIYNNDISNNNKMEDVGSQLGSGFTEICDKTVEYKGLIEKFREQTKKIYEKLNEYRGTKKDTIREYISSIKDINNNTNVMLLRTLELYNKFFPEFESLMKQIKGCYETDKKISIEPLDDDFKKKRDETKEEVKYATKIMGEEINDMKIKSILDDINLNEQKFNLMIGGFNNDQKIILDSQVKEFQSILNYKKETIKKLEEKNAVDFTKYGNIKQIADNSLENFEHVIKNYLNTYKNLNVVLRSMINKLNDCKCEDIDEKVVICDDVPLDTFEYTVIPAECV